MQESSKDAHISNESDEKNSRESFDSDENYKRINPQRPSPDKKSRTPIKFSRAGEALYERGQEFLNSVELKRQEMVNNEHSFKPKINTMSEKMIKTALKEGRNPREKKAKEETKIDTIEEEKKIKPKGDVKEFIKRNYTNALSKTKTLEKSDGLDSECTFMPKISDKSKEMVHNQHYDLHQQAEDLKKKKQEKIDEAIKKKAAAELDGCTFRPQLIKAHATYSPQAKTKKQTETTFGYSKNKPSRLFINT